MADDDEMQSLELLRWRLAIQSTLIEQAKIYNSISPILRKLAEKDLIDHESVLAVSKAIAEFFEAIEKASQMTAKKVEGLFDE